MSKSLINHVKLTSFVGVLGISSLIALPAFSQKLPANPIDNSANPVNRVITSRSNTIRNGTLTGGNATYPYGSRINADGIISTPRGERTIPNVSVKRGDGSTTHYYLDGSHITIERPNIPPTGTLIR